MDTRYTVRFKNSTNSSYHFAVYQKYPDSPGLDSVAWQVRGLAPGAIGRVDWKLDYQVAIADWDTDNKQYSGSQLKPASLGKVYEVITTDGDIPGINPSSIDTTGPGLIQLQNKTKPPKAVTMGFAIDQSLVVAEKKVRGGEAAEFSVHPQYYIACFRNIKHGQLVSAGIELGPVTLEFKQGYTDYTVVAAIDDGGIVLKDPVPTSSS